MSLSFPYVKPKVRTGRVCREESLTKCEVGFTPQYKKNFEGRVIDNSNRVLAQKNTQNAWGICKTCPHVVKSKLKTVTGEHCRLEKCER